MYVWLLSELRQTFTSMITELDGTEEWNHIFRHVRVWSAVVRGTRMNPFLSRGKKDEGRPFPSHPFFIGFFQL